jgi:hypothetical protein
MPMNTPAGAAQDSIMTDSTIPTTTSSPLPNPAIAPATGESIQVNGTTTTTTATTATTADLSVTTTAHLVTEAEKVVLTNPNSITQDLTLSDITHAPILSAADLLPQDSSSLIESSHVTMTPSIPSVDLTPLSATVPAGFGVSILPGLDLSVNAANDEFIVLDNGLITGAWRQYVEKTTGMEKIFKLKSTIDQVLASQQHCFFFSRKSLVIGDHRNRRFRPLECSSISSDKAGCTSYSGRRHAAKQCPIR